ncbi:MAG: ABC transporter ATP-binding protein, partial [Verrucomicrobia bacterium]|nr:ABC transporter ATP-binding protein [Verrucomicrobiota bacterium]
MPAPLLQIEHLSLGFETDDGLLRAVEDLSLRIDTGEIVCLVGESGCGKSITAQSIARLIPNVKHLGGRILLEGVDTCALSGKELRAIRGKGVSYIFQDPALALNPAMTIGAQIMEAFTLHQPERANHEQCVRALEEVGIPSPELRVNEYPHQLSGGMKQRVMIAMALACRPKLLVADEPTTALDVTIQAQILCLLNELRAQYRMSILLITHNLGIVSQIADRVAVMYAGQIVEQGTTRQILDTPAHPYTKALLAAVPRIGFDVKRLHAIPGQVPPLYDMPQGCRFHPRC